MKPLKDGLVCLVLALIAWMVFEAIQFERTATAAARQLPLGIVETRKEVLAEVDRQVSGLGGQLTGQIEGARKELLSRADRQLTDLRSDAMDQFAETRKASDRRVGDSLERVDTFLAEVKPIADGAAKTLDGLQPVLDNSTAAAARAAGLLRDTQASWDDAYLDLYSLLSSTEVAVHGVGEMADTIAKATPSITKSVDTVGQAAAAEARKITEPKPWYARIFGPLFDALRLLALIL